MFSINYLDGVQLIFLNIASPEINPKKTVRKPKSSEFRVGVSRTIEFCVTVQLCNCVSLTDDHTADYFLDLLSIVPEELNIGRKPYAREKRSCR